MSSILIVDDELSMQEFLLILLKKEGYDMDACGDVASARSALSDKRYDLVITDLKLPDGTGLEVLPAASKADPDTQVVVITAFGSAATAVEAMKRGAYDYLTKPFKIEHIKVTVQKALERASLARENRELKRRVEAAGVGGEIVGRSARAVEMLRLVERVAPTGVAALISGESGTGKELVARRLHELSGRKGPFVPVNCSAIPEGMIESELFGHVKGGLTGAVDDRAGLFEEAQGGTLFLDEVSELPLTLQPKLLRALEEGKVKRVGDNREIAVDVRLVSASNRDLLERVRGGSFREDLYYRLNVVVVEIPALRQRPEDIPLLAQHFLAKYRTAFNRSIRGIAPDALKCLERYPFPGNIRELENLIERAVALEAGNMLGVESLPEPVRRGGEEQFNQLDPLPPDGVELDGILAGVERGYIRQALERTGGNKTEAAKLLGMSFRSFRYRVEKLKEGKG